MEDSKRIQGEIESLAAKKVREMPPSGIRKFFDLAEELPDVISLGVGEPDFQTPEHIREKGMASLKEGKTFYTSNAGLLELRQAISGYAKKRYGLDYDPKKEILVTVGGSEGVDIALRALVDPGDEVICPDPSFVCYGPCTILAGGVPVSVRLKEENRFRLTREDLEKVITPKSKVLILSYPNNPTGAIMEREDLEALVPVIKEHNLVVVSDEIYSELTYGKDHVSMANLPGMQERTVVINGFSKSYAMTGWRMGYVLGHKDIVSQMTKIHQYAIMCAPTMSQYAAVEALENGDEDVSRMRGAYDERRKYLYQEFQRLGMPCFEPQGAFYMFPNIQRYGLDCETFAMKLLEEEQVAVVPGNAFGNSGEGFLRVSYASSMENLKEAVRRIERFLGRLA